MEVFEIQINVVSELKCDSYSLKRFPFGVSAISAPILGFI